MEPLTRSPNEFAGCFGCGPENGIGLKLEFGRDGDWVEAVTRLESSYAGYREFAHGGVVATMLDEAMGWALVHVGGAYGVTSRLEIEYKRPVPLDRTIRIRARVVERAERTASIEAQLLSERGRVHASALGHWSIVRKERAAAD